MNTHIKHLVLYQTNPANLQAVDQIVENATKYLESIPSVQEFSIGRPLQTGRVVSDGFLYDVALDIEFANESALAEYMSHPSHIKFVEFVLNGWMKKGSTLQTTHERRNEFIDTILYGKSEDQPEWAIDVDVASDKRVWQAEQVLDYKITK